MIHNLRVEINGDVITVSLIKLTYTYLNFYFITYCVMASNVAKK